MDKLLSEILTRPNASVVDLDYVSARNMKDITAWNSRPLEVVDRCIHEVIHDHALSKPNAEAVCDEHGILSYRDLDQISSRLASHLITLGLGPGVFVPLCFDKEVWNVVCMLAVLKAGAAFVPLTLPLLLLVCAGYPWMLQQQSSYALSNMLGCYSCRAAHNSCGRRDDWAFAEIPFN